MLNENEVSKEVLQFEKDLVFVRDFLEDLPKRLDFLDSELDRLQGEQLDLLHYMEFRKLSANDGYKAYSKIHKVQNERRQVKDLLDVFKITNNKLKSKMPNIAIFNSCVGEVRAVVERHKLRKYKPRQLKDLDYGDHVGEITLDINKNT